VGVLLTATEGYHKLGAVWLGLHHVPNSLAGRKRWLVSVTAFIA